MKLSPLLNNKRISEGTVATGVLVSRLGLLPANVSPLGSLGFFGNPVWYAVTIVLFDFLIKGIYPGVLFTYLGFAMYPLLGYLARKNYARQLALIPVASVLFFFFSNLGVWWYWYDHTWSQLVLCYTLALPFYSRTLFGDMVFGYVYVAIQNRAHIWAHLELIRSSLFGKTLSTYA